MEHTDAGLAWDILRRFVDPATAEFDAVLAAADLPDDVARALRFWHRESLANVRQFAAEALPAVFEAVHTAQRDAYDATRRAGTVLPGEAQARPRTLTIALPDVPTPAGPSASHLEERRRTVAARLAEIG